MPGLVIGKQGVLQSYRSPIGRGFFAVSLFPPHKWWGVFSILAVFQEHGAQVKFNIVKYVETKRDFSTDSSTERLEFKPDRSALK